jgi:hypothetical protein
MPSVSIVYLSCFVHWRSLDDILFTPFFSYVTSLREVFTSFEIMPSFLIVFVFRISRAPAYAGNWIRHFGSSYTECFKRALQKYSKCYCVASVTKLSFFQGDERWLVCTPLSVNVSVTLAKQQHLDYHCKALFETSCITSGSHIEL